MSRDSDENGLERVVAGALRRWLDKARDAVMAPYRQHKIQPDPTAVYQTQADWNGEVDTILTHVGQIAMGAWSRATDVPPVSRHAFIVAYLADVRNLLVRIPDEVANLVFAEINDGVNNGENLDQIAARVDALLRFTGSENWPNRARVIARTETTRAYGAGTMAAGMEQSRVSGRQLRKQWRTERDERVRRVPFSHVHADNQIVSVFMPFMVGGEALMFPGDPTGSPENVINCRCDIVILNEEGGRG